MSRWYRTLSSKLKMTFMVISLLTAQVAGAALPFMPTGTAHAAPTCTVDTAGANDVPGQKDLTQMCTDTTNLPTTEKISWDWDDAGSQGNNSMDACALFDTDGDGNANYSACVTTNGDPATFSSLTIYSCGDGATDKCTQQITLLSGPYASSCTVDQESTDPFSGSGKNQGDDYPYDTVANCTVYLSDVGGGQVASLIDVCSYPSQQPNSDPSDCVVAIPGEAKLTVVKDLVPSTDTGRFDLKIDGTTYATNVGDGGSTGAQIVTADHNNSTHTVLEQADSTTNATSLDDYSTSVVCKDLHGTGQTLASGTPTGSLTRQLSVTVASDSDVVCTFTNTRATGTITVTKVVDNNYGGNATASQFPLYVNSTQVTSGATNTYTANQSYTVSENGGPSGYTQTSLTCTDDTGASLGATFTLAAGENVHCTITNADIAPTLDITKHVINDNGGTMMSYDFKLYVNGALQQDAKKGGGTVADNSTTYLYDNALANTPYTISEAATQGYAQQSIVCVDQNTQQVVAQPVVLSPGQFVDCTITNDDIAPQLTVIKNVVNGYGGNAQPGDFTMNVTGTDVSNGSFPGSETGTTVTLNAGSYAVGESGGPSGYTGSFSSDCSGTVAVGDSKTCTVTNTQQPASISGSKYEVNADSTIVGAVQNWTVYLLLNGQPIKSTTTDANGNYSFTGLNWGNYTLAECLNVSDNCSGWTQIYSPSGVSVSGSSLTSANNDFGNFKNATISGSKFNDLNGNGAWDNGEPGLTGWTIFIDGNGNGQLDSGETSTVTDQNGDYSITNLAPGAYSLCEVAQANWTQTYPATANGCQTVTVALSGHDYTDVDFGNQAHGTITLVKDLVPANDPGLFNLQIDGTTYAANVGNNGTTGAVDVVAGTYTVAETAGTSTDLADYSSVVSCDYNNGMRGGSETGTSTSGLTISAGDNLVCTFTNTRKTGTVTVNKIVNPANDSGKFDLLIGGTTYATDIGDGGTTGAVTLPTGTYTVSETAGTGTSLADYSSSYQCSDGQTGSGTSVDITAVYGQNVSCTFTNVRYGHIIVKKVTDPSGASQPFTFTSDYEASSFNLKDGESNDSGNLLPGTYAVSEAQYLDWNLDSATCDNGDTPDSISLAAGQTVTCTFVNHGLGTVTVTKVLLPTNDGGKFNLQIDGTTYAANVGNNGTTGYIVMPAGAHTVSETAGTGTDLNDYDSSYICRDSNIEDPSANVIVNGAGTTSQSFTVDTDEDVSCLFVNVRKATLTIIKKAYPIDSAQHFTFTLSKVVPAAGQTTPPQQGFVGVNDALSGFTLDGNTDPTYPNSYSTTLSALTVYDVTETATPGWNLADIDCGNITTVKTATGVRFELEPGQDLTCTFTNQKPVIPQVLGTSTTTSAPKAAAELTNTGLPLVGYITAALSLIGAAVFASRYRKQVQ